MVRSLPIGLFALALSACSLDKSGIGEDLSLGDVGFADTIEPIDSATVFDTDPIEDTSVEDTFAPDTAAEAGDTSVADGADAFEADVAIDVAPEAETGGDLVPICTEVVAGTNIDLTAEGTAGWAHYGFSDTQPHVHKITPDAISALTTTGTSVRFGGFEVSSSWSDGIATVMTTPTKTGFYVADPGAELAFAVMGDGTPRTLRVYIRPGAGAKGTMTLSVGASKTVTDLPRDLTTTKNLVCAVTFASSSSLQVAISKVGAGSSIGLRSATLH